MCSYLNIFLFLFILVSCILFFVFFLFYFYCFILSGSKPIYVQNRDPSESNSGPQPHSHQPSMHGPAASLLFPMPMHVRHPHQACIATPTGPCPLARYSQLTCGLHAPSTRQDHYDYFFLAVTPLAYSLTAYTAHHAAPLLLKPTSYRPDQVRTPIPCTQQTSAHAWPHPTFGIADNNLHAVSPYTNYSPAGSRKLLQVLATKAIEGH